MNSLVSFASSYSTQASEAQTYTSLSALRTSINEPKLHLKQNKLYLLNAKDSRIPSVACQTIPPSIELTFIQKLSVKLGRAVIDLQEGGPSALIKVSELASCLGIQKKKAHSLVKSSYLISKVPELYLRFLKSLHKAEKVTCKRSIEEVAVMTHHLFRLSIDLILEQKELPTYYSRADFDCILIVEEETFRLFQTGSIIAHGDFGQVHEIRELMTGVKLARKIAMATLCPFEGPEMILRCKEATAREYYVMNHLGRRFGLQYPPLFGIDVEYNGDLLPAYLSEKYCGDLSSYQIKRPQEYLDMALQTAAGLQALNANNFLHLDIRPPNIFRGSITSSIPKLGLKFLNPQQEVALIPCEAESKTSLVHDTMVSSPSLGSFDSYSYTSNADIQAVNPTGAAISTPNYRYDISDFGNSIHLSMIREIVKKLTREAKKEVFKRSFNFFSSNIVTKALSELFNPIDTDFFPEEECQYIAKKIRDFALTVKDSSLIDLATLEDRLSLTIFWVMSIYDIRSLAVCLVSLLKPPTSLEIKERSLTASYWAKWIETALSVGIESNLTHELARCFQEMISPSDCDSVECKIGARHSAFANLLVLLQKYSSKTL